VLYLEIAAALVSAIGGYFSTRTSPLGWGLAAIGAALYVYIFFLERLYADMSLQAVFVITCTLGLFSWLKSAEIKTGEVGSTIQLLPVKKALQHLALGIAGAAIIYPILLAVHGAQPLFDAILTAGSLVAQYWMARKYVQCWVLWFILNTGFLVFFSLQGMYPTVALYAVFWLLCIRGYLKWKNAIGLPVAG
jgi:nicotinamide mononucleotide transporter